MFNRKYLFIHGGFSSSCSLLAKRLGSKSLVNIGGKIVLHECEKIWIRRFHCRRHFHASLCWIELFAMEISGPRFRLVVFSGEKCRGRMKSWPVFCRDYFINHEIRIPISINHYNDLVTQKFSALKQIPGWPFGKAKKSLSVFFFGGGLEYQGQLTQVFLWLSMSVHLDAPQQTTPGMMSCDLILQPKVFLTYRTGPFERSNETFLENTSSSYRPCTSKCPGVWTNPQTSRFWRLK